MRNLRTRVFDSERCTLANRLTRLCIRNLVLVLFSLSFAVNATAACQTACTVGLDDVDSDGAGDIAALLENAGAVSNQLLIISGATGRTLVRVSVGGADVTVVEFAATPDINGDGVADVAVLTTDTQGRVVISLWDSVTGTNIRDIFYERAFIPRAIIVALDGAVTAVGVLGVHTNGTVRAQLKDAADGSLISKVFFEAAFDPVAVQVLAAIDGDGSTDIAVLGVDGSGRVRAQIKDMNSGVRESLVFFDRNFTPIAFRSGIDLDASGVTDLIVVGEDDGGLVRAQIKDALTGARTSIVPFQRGFEVLDVVVVPDVGAPSVGVLGRNDTGLTRVQLKNAATTLLENMIRFDSANEPKGIAVVPDTDDNGASDLAVVGMAANGNIRLQMKDAATAGAVLNRTIYPESGNSDLASLTLNSGTLDQPVDPGQTAYTTTVGFLATSVRVTAAGQAVGSVVRVDGAVSSPDGIDVKLDTGDNPIAVEVTAPNGVATTLYTVTVTREALALFAQSAYVKASNTETDDAFGSRVALSGNTLAVGARLEDSGASGIDGNQSDNSSVDSGAVYVFTRNEFGVWSQQAYIKASNPGPGDQFGHSVALDGDTLVVGALLEDSAATGIDGDGNNNSAVDSGAVYVFTRDEFGVWSQQAYIKASNTGAGDRLGRSVTIEGDTLAVGAILEDSNATGVNGDGANDLADDSGAVYVFTRDEAGVWSQQAYLKASNTDAGDQLGRRVRISGDTLVTGANFEMSSATGINGNENDNSLTRAGAAYVFTRDGAGNWSQQAYLKASNTEALDEFGYEVAISGDTIAVVGSQEDSGAAGINGDETDNSVSIAGAVYVFTRNESGVWSQQAYIKASNPGAADLFGTSLALLGDRLAVGAALEDSAATGINGDETDNSVSNAGAAYLFTRDAGSWSQQAYIKASNTGGSDLFGELIAVSVDTLAVAAEVENGGATGINGDASDNSALDAGAVYLFE